MDPPLFGAEFIRRRQKRRKKARLSKMPSQPARDKGCGTQCLDTHNAACSIETDNDVVFYVAQNVSTHTMLRAALKPSLHEENLLIVRSPNTHNAACGIETVSRHNQIPPRGCLDTHNAACGIDSKTALRVLSVTQSRFRMQKAHSNLDDAAHYRRTLIINTVNTTRNVKEALINSALPS